MPESSVTDIARTIELAVAPVFLLSALGTLIAVLTSRLARVVDRARVLTAQGPEVPHGSLPPDRELALLSRRRELVNYAITFAVLAALFVCVLIALSFIGYMLGKNFSLLIAWLFIAAMASFIASLLFFLREIVLTVTTIRLGAG